MLRRPYPLYHVSSSFVEHSELRAVGEAVGAKFLFLNHGSSLAWGTNCVLGAFPKAMSGITEAPYKAEDPGQVSRNA